MKAKFVCVALSAAMLAAAGLSVGTFGVSAEGTYPLIYESEGKLESNEKLSYALPEAKQVTGNALSLKVFLKNTYHYSLPIGISVTADGKEYSWSRTAGTEQGMAYASPDAEQTSVPTPLQWNKSGTLEIPYMFYGEILLPFSSLNSGAGAQISSVSEISVTFTAAVNSNFASGDTWLADDVCIYLFGASCVTVDGSGAVSGGEQLVDFREVPADGVSLAAEEGNTVGKVRTATEEDNNVFRAFVTQYNSACATKGDMKIVENFSLDDAAFSAVSAERSAAELVGKFYLSGQESDYTVAEGGTDGTALLYNIDSGMYDAGKNSYAGDHFNFGRREATDWSGANGITVYVENTADHLASFALEIFQYNLETGLLEQYNLNDVGQRYKTLYAYNVETGEEFSYHTQTFMRVPANFKGWIRIPFSQYAAPAWSMTPAYGNEGVLDFEANPVVKISITRLFNANLDTQLIIDDVAVYYGDFSVGNLFDESKQSIRDCIEEGSVPA